MQNTLPLTGTYLLFMNSFLFTEKKGTYFLFMNSFLFTEKKNNCDLLARIKTSVGRHEYTFKQMADGYQ